MAQSSFPQKGVSLSLDRISRLLEDFPISSRMGRARRLAGSRRARIALNAFFVSSALVAAARHSGGVQAGFALVAAAGVAAAALVLCLPCIARLGFVSRWKVGRWLREHTACPRSASQAWFLISVSWALRALAVFVLLNALAVGGSFTLALAFLCASAASAALPIAPAGAATQAGAGAAILIANGVHTTQAIAFGVAAQALVVVTGAAVMLLVAAGQLALRLRPGGLRGARHG